MTHSSHTSTHTHTCTGDRPVAPTPTLARATGLSSLHPRQGAAPPGGFTLVEMAIIVIIVGMIAALVIPAITSRITMERGAQGKGDVVSVRDEIIGFAMTQTPPRLPEENPPGAIESASDPANTDLGKLPKAQAKDFWGQQYGYRRAAFPANSDPCVDVPTNLSVKRGGEETPNVAFIVKSNGPNMRDDVEDFTRPFPLPPDVLRVDIPATGEAVTIGTETRAFDDIVEFVTLSHLRSRVDCASSPSPAPQGAQFTEYGFSDGNITGSGSSGLYTYSLTNLGSNIRELKLSYNSNLQLTIVNTAQITYSTTLDSIGGGSPSDANRGLIGSSLLFIFPVNTHTSFYIDLVSFDAADRATVTVRNGAVSLGTSLPFFGTTATNPERVCITPTGTFDRFLVDTTTAYTFGVRSVFAPAPTDGSCDRSISIP